MKYMEIYYKRHSFGNVHPSMHDSIVEIEIG
jgi:hypothetical protein